MSEKRPLLTALCLLLIVGIANAEETGGAPNYRSWQHVKSMLIQPGHPLENPFAGIHHIYANAESMHGLISGQYETGAVFVFDLLAYEQGDHVIVEGARKRLDVMRYDPERFAETGGWDFSTYLPNAPSVRVEQDVTQACFSCHTGAQQANYVFSQYRP